MEHQGRFVAYYRVSTEEQGKSGLGLEAQRKAVLDFLNGGRWDLLAEFTEVETGKGRNAMIRRPQLADALALCRKKKATLVIAKLDRLSRNLAFLANLMESKVAFIAADNPHASPLTIHILSAVAEDEVRRISERTKAALAAAKARGVVLGQTGRENAARLRAEARAYAARLAPTILELRAEGFTSLRALVAELNRRRVPTPKGGAWHLKSVHRLVKRVAVAPATPS